MKGGVKEVNEGGGDTGLGSLRARKESVGLFDVCKDMVGKSQRLDWESG